MGVSLVVVIAVVVVVGASVMGTPIVVVVVVVGGSVLAFNVVVSMISGSNGSGSKSCVKAKFRSKAPHNINNTLAISL